MTCYFVSLNMSSFRSISIFARNKFSLAIYVLRVAITCRYFEFLCVFLQKNDNVMKNAMGLTEYPNQVNVKEEDTYNLELKPTSLYQGIEGEPLNGPEPIEHPFSAT